MLPSGRSYVHVNAVLTRKVSPPVSPPLLFFPQLFSTLTAIAFIAAFAATIVSAQNAPTVIVEPPVCDAAKLNAALGKVITGNIKALPACQQAMLPAATPTQVNACLAFLTQTVADDFACYQVAGDDKTVKSAWYEQAAGCSAVTMTCSSSSTVAAGAVTVAATFVAMLF